LAETSGSENPSRRSSAIALAFFIVRKAVLPNAGGTMMIEVGFSNPSFSFGQFGLKELKSTT
jgi:hypothetical protein